LECNSREGVIDFIEKSGNAPLFRNYYQSLLAEADFIKKLEEILKLTRNKPLTCQILFSPDQKVHEHLIHQIDKHLSMVGIKTILDKQEMKKRTANLTHAASSGKDHIIYVIPEMSSESVHADTNEENLGISQIVET